MSARSDNNCCDCEERHPRQAFISHAGKDAEIVREIAKSCCAAQITPYLFEYSAEFSQSNIDKARTIANEINNSDIFLVVLGPSVSNAYWTQAWIGFEIGVSIGVDLASDKTRERDYFSSKIFVLRDIHQEIKVSVPRVDVLFLYDFSQSWDDIRDLLTFMSAYISASGAQVFQLGNALRQRIMTGKAKCENATCEGDYDVVIPFNSARALESWEQCNDKEFKKLQWIKKEFQAKFNLSCPSCGKKVHCEISRSL